MKITRGFADGERALIADLYWGAFGQKLGRVMGPRDTALGYLVEVMDPGHALSARNDAGDLLGVVGFKTHEGAFVGGTGADLARHYGRFGSLWRMGLLALLERDVENERFLMDGIFVARAARGQGVGTALLEAVAREAADRGFAELRLDVIDSNPRARALYEREGFVAVETQHLGPLRHVFDFKSATTMVRQVG